MLTFKQSLVLLVSIITVLAIIAIITGLSPLYWPHPKPVSKQIKFLTTTPISSTQMTTRLKAVTKKKLQLTTVKVTTTLPMTTNIVSANASVDQT